MQCGRRRPEPELLCIFIRSDLVLSGHPVTIARTRTSADLNSIAEPGMTLAEPDVEALQRLLEGSLVVWRLDGTVEAVAAEPPTVLIRTSRGLSLRVVWRREPNLPPCWEVSRAEASEDGDEAAPLLPRRYAAVPGMLRGVRAVLDPDAPGGRLIIGAG